MEQQAKGGWAPSSEKDLCSLLTQGDTTVNKIINKERRLDDTALRAAGLQAEGHALTQKV